MGLISQFVLFLVAYYQCQYHPKSSDLGYESKFYSFVTKTATNPISNYIRNVSKAIPFCLTV